MAVAQTVSDFITVMDSLKLGMKAVDEVLYRAICVLCCSYLLAADKCDCLFVRRRSSRCSET